MPWGLIAAVAFGLVFLLLLSGLQVAASLGLVGIITAYVFLGRLGVLEYACWKVSTDFVLVAIPLFILMGQLLLRSGLSTRLYEGSSALLARVPGGLLHSNIISCAIFAAISGSSVATAATIGSVAIPELEKRGYDHRMVVGSLAAGGTLGILIPPSISMIIYGAMCEQSVGTLFIAGILPGIMLSLLFVIYIMLRVTIHPQLAPRYEKIPVKQRVRSIIGMWPIIVTIVIVLGGIYLGVMTPTEAAAVGAFTAFIFTIAYRQLPFPILRGCLRETVKTTAMLMFLVMGAQLVTASLTYLRVTDNAVAWATSLSTSPLIIFTLICLLYLFFGCFMDGVSLEVITLPIVFPIIAGLGFDPIWFGVTLVILIEIALITPPVGMNVYVIHGLCPDTSLTEVFRGVIPFFFLMLAGLAIVTVFPPIATWLPGTMKAIGG